MSKSLRRYRFALVTCVAVVLAAGVAFGAVISGARAATAPPAPAQSHTISTTQS